MAHCLDDKLFFSLLPSFMPKKRGPDQRVPVMRNLVLMPKSTSTKLSPERCRKNMPLSLRQVEDLLFEHSIDICYETVRFWWEWVGPMFAAEIRKRRVHHHQFFSYWRWHLDEVFVRISGAQLITKVKCWKFLPRNGRP